MKEIIVCETWAQGFEHADFNAALLRTIGLAFPEANVLFLSEQDHGGLVRQRLQHAPDASVTYGRVSVPRRGMFELRQFITEFGACWHVLSLARRRSTGALVFSCLKGSSLLALKAVMCVLGIKILTVGVIHGELSTVLAPQQRRPWNRALALHSALKLPAPRWLRLLVLGESIRREMVKIMPSRLDVWRSMELVSLHVGDRTGNPRALALGQPIRFGFLGAASKGFDAFCRVAQTVKTEFPDAEFEMVGFLGKTTAPENAGQYVIGISASPLAPEEYQMRLEGQTYCVSLDRPKHHRLAGSATFVDALSQSKPFIALRNPYLAYYFDILGDIGYLCDSVEEVSACIRDILRERPAERYARQVENIVKGRGIFTPENAAPKIRQVLRETAASPSLGIL